MQGGIHTYQQTTMVAKETKIEKRKKKAKIKCQASKQIVCKMFTTQTELQKNVQQINVQTYEEKTKKKGKN